MKSIVVVVVLFLAVNARQLPEKVSGLLCRRSNPDYEKCMNDNFKNNFLDFATNGLPELGIPPLDPLKVPYLHTKLNFQDIAKLNATFENLVVSGISGLQLDSYKIDVNLPGAILQVTVPELAVSVKYDLTGEVLGNPVHSKGLFKGIFSNILVFISGSLKPVDRDGVEYYEIDDLNIKLSVGGAKIQATSDDPEEQEFVDYFVNFFNNNFHTVMELITPLLVSEGTEAHKKFLNTYLAKAPAAEWIPE